MVLDFIEIQISMSQSLEHIRCYYVSPLFISFGFRDTAVTYGRVAYGAALACGTCVMSQVEEAEV